MQLREQCFDAISHFDHVRAGLALNIQNDGALLVCPAGELCVLDAVRRIGDLLQADRRAVPIGQNQRSKRLGFVQLVVRGDGVALARPVERAFGLIDVRRHDGSAHVLPS